MSSTTEERTITVPEVPPTRASKSRTLRALGEQRPPRVPAAVDLSDMTFALVVPGGGAEFAPSPLRRTGTQSGSHLEEVPPVGAWAARGVCRNQTELFFPVRGQRPQAAVDCNRCPVREPCLAYGLSHPAQLGVLGGMTVEERRRVRGATKAATRAARGTEDLPVYAVLENLARYPVMTWGRIARSGDDDALIQLAFELGAGWRALPPGRWEFDVEWIDGAAVLRARLVERDLSMLLRSDPSAEPRVDTHEPELLRHEDHRRVAVG